MSKITAIIADDEPLLRFHLDKALAEAWPELEIVAAAENGEQALKLIEQYQPTVAFLDIKMPKLTGMQVAQQLGKMTQTPPAIVFVTAYDQHAIEAFDNNAVDYILKPIQDERLLKCCDKLKQQFSQEGSATDLDGLLSKLSGLQISEPKTYVTWLKASIRDDIHLISVAKIAYIKAEDKYLTVVCETEEGGFREYTIRGALKDLITQLNPDDFWQIHRSTVIHLPYVNKVNKDITGKLIVCIADKKLPVSRSLQHLFK